MDFRAGRRGPEAGPSCKGSPSVPTDELFPLPRWADGCSRASRRRSKAACLVKEYNGAVDALNWMAGCPYRRRSGGDNQSSLHGEVCARIWLLVRERAPAPDAPSGEAALKKLLRGTWTRPIPV